jgi:hypothetical protein
MVEAFRAVWNEPFSPDYGADTMARRALAAAIRAAPYTEAMIAAGWIDKEDVSPKEIFRAMADALADEIDESGR